MSDGLEASSLESSGGGAGVSLEDSEGVSFEGFDIDRELEGALEGVVAADGVGVDQGAQRFFKNMFSCISPYSFQSSTCSRSFSN